MTDGAAAAPSQRVTIPARDGVPVTPLYARLPPGATRGVVVIHEIFGPQPEMDRVVDRFARAGYAAVAPDLFSEGPKAVCVARAFRQARTGVGRQHAQIQAARAWLAAETGLVNERIGLIGFCLGGGFALAAGPGWGAVSANYCQVPPDPVLAEGGPVIACFGERDHAFTPHAEKLRTALARTGRRGEVHVVPGVGHSFLSDGDHPVARFAVGRLMGLGPYDPSIGEPYWAKILAWFDACMPAPR